jgi:opacity protein-like surface antigen
MKIKLAVAALALVVATPAFAVDYYVVQNAKSKKCTVATKKPGSDKAVLVGDTAGYKTKKDAQDAMKGADACKKA